MFYAVLLILFSTLGQASLVMYLPAFSEISLTYQLTASQVAQSVTLYLAFFALGQLILGSLSDRYHPCKILTVSFLLYLLGIAFVFLPNIAINFFMARALQGVAAGGVVATARGMVNRSYHGQRLVTMLTLTALDASQGAPSAG